MLTFVVYIAAQSVPTAPIPFIQINFSVTLQPIRFWSLEPLYFQVNLSTYVTNNGISDGIRWAGGLKDAPRGMSGSNSSPQTGLLPLIRPVHLERSWLERSRLLSHGNHEFNPPPLHHPAETSSGARARERASGRLTMVGWAWAEQGRLFPPGGWRATAELALKPRILPFA